MTPELVVELAQKAIKITLLVSLPILGIGLIVGVLVSVLQAATQIQEMTLTFVPKILSILVGLLFLLPWIMNQLTGFTLEILTNLPNYTRRNGIDSKTFNILFCLTFTFHKGTSKPSQEKVRES